MVARIHRRVVLGMLGTLLWQMWLSAAALAVRTRAPQNVKATQYEVKAAYLYHLGGFVGWSRNVDRTDGFRICVLGVDPFGATLDAVIRDEVIDKAPVVAKRISSAHDALACRVVFIASSEEPQLTQTLAILQKANILTVSDIPHFTERGGMIQFVLDGNRVRFEVNLAPAEKAGLTFSSELLKLAVRIKGK